MQPLSSSSLRNSFSIVLDYMMPTTVHHNIIKN